MAFQLIDDALDYAASPEELGKNLGDDLNEGKSTLPLIYAMENGSRTEKKMIRMAVKNGELEKLSQIQSVIDSTGALEYTIACAKEASEIAIDSLAPIPNSDYKQGLITIAEFAVNRRF